MPSHKSKRKGYKNKSTVKQTIKTQTITGLILNVKALRNLKIWATLFSASMIISVATGIGAIMELLIQTYLTSTTQLSNWTAIIMVGSAANAVTRYIAIFIGIYTGTWTITTQGKKAQKTRKIGDLTKWDERAQNIAKSFESLKYVITAILVGGISILIQEQQIEIPVPPWIKDYPISTAAGTFTFCWEISSEGNIKRIIGENHHPRWMIKFGKIVAIVTAIGLIATSAIGFIILLIRKMSEST